jgi:hypothetical protein
MNKYERVRQELMAVERAAWWNPRVRRILKAAPLVVLFLLLNSRPARASCSFSPTPDPTADGASNSLRAAIQGANASGQDCLIQLQAGTYTLSIKNTNGQENAAAQGDLDITDSGHTVTIQGQGAQASIINGNGVNGIDDRVFQVLGGANAVFRKLTIEGGIAQDDGTAGVQPGTTQADGGGLLVQDGGHVTLSEVAVENNQATGGNGASATKSSRAGKPGYAAAGGGLFLAAGSVELRHSKIFRNATKGGTGGNGAESFTTHGTFSGPGGAGGLSAGGGLYVLSGRARLMSSTVSGNVASGGGGGAGGGQVETCGGASGGNGGSGRGAGLFVGTGEFSLRQTVVSGNSAMGGTGGNGGCCGSRSCGGSGGSSQGAGVFVSNGHIHLDNSTIFSNTAKGGLGIGALSGSCACTVYSAGGSAAGGGLYLSSGTVSLVGDTVASNQALTGFQHAPMGPSSGGGIAIPLPSAPGLPLTSTGTNTTLIANNVQDSGNANNGDDVSGAITSSYSLIGETAGATITDNGGNIFDEDPSLDPRGLCRNGGPTQTVALQIGSPAIDVGGNALCASASPTGLGGIDQRGYSRFPHGDNLCDIGAFEFYNLLVHPKFAFFGAERVGQQGQSRNLSITNNQASSVSLSTTIGGNDPADFIENDNCGATLAANTSCTIAITFKPAATGERSAVITVNDSPDRTSPYTVGLAGEGK